MRITPLICAIQHALGDADKALEDLAFQVDAKQWVRAGIALGRIQELAARVVSVARLGDEVLSDSARDASATEAHDDPA